MERGQWRNVLGNMALGLDGVWAQSGVRSQDYRKQAAQRRGVEE